MTDTVTFELDGEPVTAAADETLWQVAQRHGTEQVRARRVSIMSAKQRHVSP